ncbi:MAG: glycosyltransferase family 4 protein, partial [Planctomycetaceae bacterium]|nr:glycosyltransferase family 4 protein [Planctomycetaceae bacterium]
LKTTPIAPMMDWNDFLCEPNELSRQYVTFINPEPGKGVYIFAQIAKQLWERRPEIPLLVVEGRAGADWLARTGVDFEGVRNLSLMANTPDPRDFYRVTKIMLVPSLFMESFGRVAAEAMINGIPVIASHRGALPEVIGDAGITLDIPAQYTPDTRIAPSPDEVEPWVNAIIHLWDDTPFYNDLVAQGRTRAQRWHPEIIAQHYDNALAELISSEAD